MIRRPKPGEGEEDLLRMQEEYLLEKCKDPKKRPAAQVTSLQLREPTAKRSQASGQETATRKPSKYAQSKGLTNYSEKRPRIDDSTNLVMGDILEKKSEQSPLEYTSSIEDDKVYFPVIMPSVLGNIVEKNLDVAIDFHNQLMPSQGFPEITKRDPALVSGIKSIHRQDIEMKQKDFHMEVDKAKLETISDNSHVHRSLPEQSYIVSSNDANEIHTENLKLLSSMSEKDLIEEQQKLLAGMDPKLVQFIKAKRLEKSSDNNKVKFSEVMDTAGLLNDETPITTTEMEIKIENSLLNDKPPNDNLWDNDVLTHPRATEWLHFNSLETDKLEWMKGIEESKCKPDEPYEARFDFTGYLLPYTFEYTEKTKSLYHHGEEPHRPGYSLTELIELSRSTITQQRVMALNTIAGILEYYSAGTYKDIIELPLSKLFFIIRIAMDENKVIILEPALKAMRNLLYNRIDEASMDALIGFEEGTRQPWLENDKSEIEELESKESELKDFHLAEIDLIAAILRTDVLQRLYYVLDSVRPSFNCVQYILQILTRLARDSLETALKILQFADLMHTIVKNFLPTTSINFMFDPQMVYKGKPILSAVRLLRVLSLQSEEAAHILVDKYGTLQPISEYISSGVDGTYGLRIQIEAYCLLSNLVTSGMDTAISLLPIVITTLYKHVQGTDICATSSIISATHAAVVLQLINKILNYHHNKNIDTYKSQIYPLLVNGIQKWMRQISQADAYTCAHLRLLCSAIDCSTTALLIENVPITFLNDSLKHLSSSQGFKAMINNLEQSSNLLSGLENKNLHFTKNLMSLGGSVIDSEQKVLPILNMASPLPFLASLYKLLTQVNDKTIARSFLQHLTPYLKKLAKQTPALTDNWFTRIEVDFVFNVLKVATQTDVSECDKDLFYAIANKFCYVLRSDKRYEVCYLFEKLVFNKDWFTTERLLHLLNLSEDNSDVKALQMNSSLDEIKCCYDRVINSSCISPGENICLLKWREPILPRDWIYMPILALYSRRHIEEAPKIIDYDAVPEVGQEMGEKRQIISCSLEWILFNEICFQDLLSDIDITDRFCRIMCVFLCDDSLFLDPKINILLHKCTQALFKQNADFNFSKQLVGLHNFEDFFTEILQQFQSVSYGDATFASCVLVPLAQRHPLKWRQLIWYEYVGCLRYLDCPQELLCYPLDDYMYPEETNRRMLESYHRALSLNYVRPDTVAYKIASHHVECYKKLKYLASPDAGDNV